MMGIIAEHFLVFGRRVILGTFEVRIVIIRVKVQIAVLVGGGLLVVSLP